MTQKKPSANASLLLTDNRNVLKYYSHIQLRSRTSANPANDMPRVKRSFIFPGILFAAICLLMQFLISSPVVAQGAFNPYVNCTNGCTAKDIKKISAALVYPTAPYNQLPASFSCNTGDPVSVKLAVFLTTNTQKAGIYVYANIRNSSTNALLGTVSECFSTGALTTVGDATKVVFSQLVTWTCGTGVKLTDVYVAWGTGTEDFCVGSPAPRCPATTSKCYSLAAGEYVPVVVPVGTPADATRCSDAAGGTTATFNLHLMDATILAGQSGTVTYYLNSDFTGAIAPNESAYVSISKTIYARIVSNGVSSAPIPIILTVKPKPAAPALGKVDNCNITSTITATGLADGATLAWSDGGSGNPRTVNTTTALTVTQTVDGCTSAASNSVTPAPKTTPDPPTLGNVDNCNGTSTITATNFTGTLTWSDGGSGNPRIVSNTTALTVTQTVNGCTSASSNSVTPAPKTTPDPPTLGKLDNCNGTSTITATNFTGTLTWSDGGSGNPRIVSNTTALTVTQTVNGCTSASSNSVTPAPKTTPDPPTLGKLDNCNGTSTITATNFTGTLTWSDGGSGNPRIVSNTTALTVTQTVNGCTSASSNSVTPAPKTTPDPPTLGKLDNCNGTSTITATNFTGTLTWSDGGSGNPRIVSNTTALTVTQTVNGCTSASSNSVTPAPKTTPGAPSLGKVDNCDGTSTITATGLVGGATLTWSDGGSGNPRTVSNTTPLTLTQTVNGCTSASSNSVTPAPKTTPGAPSICVIQPSLCGPATGTIQVLSPSAGDSYSLNDGPWQPGNVFSGLAAGSNPSIKVKNAGGCISAATPCSNASVCEPAPADGRPAPTGPSSKTDISGPASNTQPQAKTVVSFDDPSSTSVKAYPNPFSDRVKFVITSSTAGQANLDLYNYLGQKVRTVYSGYIHVGTQTIDLHVPVKQTNQMTYVLRMGDKKVTGKLLQINQ